MPGIGQHLQITATAKRYDSFSLPLLHFCDWEEVVLIERIRWMADIVVACGALELIENLMHRHQHT